MKAAVPSRRTGLALAVGLLLAPGLARGWWNEEWSGRKLFSIDTSAAGGNISDPIGRVPVLFRLHAGNFRFDAAKEDGSDLRFVAGDDKTPLPFHIEKYDSLLAEALVWVSLPDLKPGARTNVWLYYKNPKAVAAEDAKGTYDPSTVLVYHFADAAGQSPHDSSAFANHAATAGAASENALIGRGLRLDGQSTVTVPATPSLDWPAGAKLTLSVWIHPAEANETGVLFSRRDGTSALVVGTEGGKPYVALESASGAVRAEAKEALAAGGWHQLSITAGEAVALYVDGAPAASAAGALPALATSALIGGDLAPAPPPRAPQKKLVKGAREVEPPAPAPPPGFKGDLDELELAKVERPAGFLKTLFLSQGTDPGKFLVAGPEEESGGGGVNYFTILIKSVTIDGWVVIGLLAIMAVISWSVMGSKASYLGAVERANDAFAARFRELSSDLAALIGGRRDPSALGEAKVLAHSPLYRLYQIAAREMDQRTRNGRPLTSEGLEVVRASLDAGLVRENQRLNQKMVLLTIAISGGPFLGLLGTVVGVMITFASIAAAGDVNVNAIAPGIAAALVATVAGLAVAIPALFAYNWLLTRVKNVSATLQVFVDELVTKGAEAFAENGKGAARPTAIASE